MCLCDPLIHMLDLRLSQFAEAVPRNHPQPQESRNTAEHQCDNALRLEACRQRGRRQIVPGEVEIVLRIACAISSDRLALVAAHLVMVLWDGEGLLQLLGRFDHGCDEPGIDMPFYVAVEQPDA